MPELGHRLFHDHAFALVDRMLFPADECPSGLHIAPLVPQRLKDSERMLPGLVSLGSLSDGLVATCLDLLAEQVAAGGPLLFSALLKTDASADAVAQHFRSTLVAKVLGGELYLRQFDPRLFVHYEWLLTPQQRVRLFGPVTGWTLHLDGEWQTFAPPSEVKPAAGWRLTAEQAARTEDAQRINRAMASLPAGGIGLRRDRAQHGHLLLERARAHGLKAERCLTRFLEHGWTVHPRFDQHPEISRRLQRMSPDDDFPYLAVLSDLDNAALSRIREEVAKGDSP